VMSVVKLSVLFEFVWSFGFRISDFGS
jgi:hypothetical protein